MENAISGLGRFVKKRRGKMSQAELGAFVDREQTWISELERGAVVYLPPPEIIRGLATGLGCPPSKLLEAAGYLDPEDPSEAMLHANQLHEARRAAENLREQAQALVGQLTAIESAITTVVEAGGKQE